MIKLLPSLQPLQPLQPTALRAVKHAGVAVIATVLVCFMLLSVLAAAVTSQNWNTQRVEISANQSFAVVQRELLARTLINAAAESIYENKALYLKKLTLETPATSGIINLKDGGTSLYSRLTLSRFSTGYEIKAEVSKSQKMALEDTSVIYATIVPDERRIIWETSN